MYSPSGLHRPCHSLHIPTNVCVGCSRSRMSRLVARRRLATSSSSCQEVTNLSAPLQHPLVPRRLIVHLRCKGPCGSVNSECEPVVHRRVVSGSECLEVVLRDNPASSAPVVPCLDLAPRLVFRPSAAWGGARGLSCHGSREQKLPLSGGSFHALAPSLLEGLSVRKLSVGAALAAVPDNSQE